MYVSVGQFLAGYPFGLLATQIDWLPSLLLLEAAALIVTTVFAIVTVKKLGQLTKSKTN